MGNYRQQRLCIIGFLIYIVIYNVYYKSEEEVTGNTRGDIKMNNAAIALLRIAALAGGAVIGALLARLVDDYMVSQSQEQPDHEGLRYAQGLSPITSYPTKETPDIYTINEIKHDDEYFG
jgi:hypothetical protein